MISGACKPTLPTVTALTSEAGFGLVTLSSSSGLRIEVNPSGAIHAIRHGTTLINQVLPGPAEDGLFRLILRWKASDGTSGWSQIAGPNVAHRVVGSQSVEWHSVVANGIDCKVSLAVHPTIASWSWRATLTQEGSTAHQVDILLAQDIGIADEAAVRNNEAFTSQYIDLLPVNDEHWGWVVLARQNQTMAGGRHPWLAVGCEKGAVGFCTDASQFFGIGHRLTCAPEAAVTDRLPSVRLQYEGATAGLQSRTSSLYPGTTREIVFIARFLPDHPDASAPSDISRLWEVSPSNWSTGTNPGLPAAIESFKAPASSLFVSAPWLHGGELSAAEWDRFFPGPRRHAEHDASGRLLAFFRGESSHVVSRAKEASVARPHGHILRSGSWRWVDNEQFGTSCYAAGVFSAQAYLGNTTLGRLLPVVRTFLGLGRGAGQRIFIRRDGAWRQLGIASAFAMDVGEARWVYHLGEETIEVRSWCSTTNPAAFLELTVSPPGRRAEFLVSHTLALDANEFDHAGRVIIDNEARVAICEPDPKSMVGTHQPATCFAIAACLESEEAVLGGDEMLHPDGETRGHPCVVIATGSAGRFGVVLCGSNAGHEGLARVVAAARDELRAGTAPSEPPPGRVRLKAATGDPTAVARLDEVLPWLNHNAAIHFSAPHGLEQQGGAAWGTRDVCQGSVEWLLAATDFPLVRQILSKVFSQQYARDGSWPQWFMHPPYNRIQQAHSHGDVCFWPVKALCDYIEASNDVDFLKEPIGYTDPLTFAAGGPEEPLLDHCDRVVDQCESRFIQGTALVNFGDGDWDDTLQPAKPEIRTKMVSSWTVALVFHAFRQLSAVYGRAGQTVRKGRLDSLLERMRADFARHLMPEATVAGFVIREAQGSFRPLLHPTDRVTGIRYRLLPMTRSILAELFTPEEATRHAELIRKELLYPDGARLMSEPATYQGGLESLFKRADTAANVGREVGLQYVHAHLRYAEAMAKLGDAEGLWLALQVVNPVGIQEVLPNAAPRQSNVYFSSSDADFGDRLEASRRWKELHSGKVTVKGGWRLYSSGPGLFLHAVRASLLGIREYFDDIIFDPVLPRGLDGLRASIALCGRPAEVRYAVRSGMHTPKSLRVNGEALGGGRPETNPYRTGGLCFSRQEVLSRLRPDANLIEIEL